jgi:hypothetical protein
MPRTFGAGPSELPELAQGRQSLDAIHIRHHQVDDRGIEGRRREGFQAVHAVVDDLRIAVLVLQEFLERGGGATIVVDDENSSHGAVTYRHSAGRRRLSFASPDANATRTSR